MAKGFTYLGSVSDRTKEIVASELGKPGENREWYIEENSDGSVSATLFDKDMMQGVSRRTLNKAEEAEEDKEVKEDKEADKPKESWLQKDRKAGGGRESEAEKYAEKYLRSPVSVSTKAEEVISKDEKPKRDDSDRFKDAPPSRRWSQSAIADAARKPETAPVRGNEAEQRTTTPPRTQYQPPLERSDARGNEAVQKPAPTKPRTQYQPHAKPVDEIRSGPGSKAAPFEMEETVVEAKRPLPVDRFKGKKPEIPKATLEKIRPDAKEDVIKESDTLDSPATKVDNPEPVELKEPKGKTPDLKKVKSSSTLTDVVIRSQKAIGTYTSPPDEVIVTNEALEDAGSAKASPPYRLVIDPNLNRAKILDSLGESIEQFAVGTGDTTGTRYGRKYFSPVGKWGIESKVPYSQKEGSYGPLWMGLTADKYGLHGPHKAADVEAGGEEFKNKGFISHGCIRFMESDILKVGEYLDIGSTVEILPYDTRPEHRGPLRVSASTPAKTSVPAKASVASPPRVVPVSGPSRGRGAPEINVRKGSK